MADICHNRPDPPRQNISTKHQRELYLFFLEMSYFRNKKYIIQKAKLEGIVDLFNLTWFFVWNTASTLWTELFHFVTFQCIDLFHVSNLFLCFYSSTFLFWRFNKKINCNWETVIYNQNSDFDNFINSFISLCWKFNWDWKYFKHNPVLLIFGKLQNYKMHCLPV